MDNKFSDFDVICMNGSFFLLGSGFYWHGAILFIVGAFASGLVNEIKSFT